MNFNAMAPLHVMHYYDPNIEESKDWDLLRKQLIECKEMGIDAISVDVWWGLVEKKNNKFDWEYYFKIFKEITSNNLDIIPIISFHSFDPGINSNFRAPLPDWIWQYISEESGLDIIDLKYNSEDIDENGVYKISDEYISLWVNEWAIPEYQDFISEFVFTFEDYFKYFQEINISLGPTGELRYPSYNNHDGGAYPNRGRMQCFSKPAKSDYFEWLKENKSKKNLSTSSFIESNNLKTILENEDYLNNNDIKDLFEWYNYSLMNHGNKMLKMALGIIPENIPIGFKIPGIHWRIKDPKMPRISEMTCGLINSRSLNGSLAYFNSLGIVLKDLPVERLILHFTCIEQKNPVPSADISTGYSRPEDLVAEVSSAAKDLSIKLKGENSLAKNLYKSSSWRKIEEVISNENYSGVTIMRVGDITEKNPIGKSQYKKIIKKLKKPLK